MTRVMDALCIIFALVMVCFYTKYLIASECADRGYWMYGELKIECKIKR